MFLIAFAGMGQTEDKDAEAWKWRVDAVEEALGIEASRRVIYPHAVDGETPAYGRFGGMSRTLRIFAKYIWQLLPARGRGVVEHSAG